MVLPSASHLIPIPNFKNWLWSLFFLYLLPLDTLLTALVFEKWVCARSYYGCYLCFYHLFTSVSLFIADLKLCTQCSARPLLAGWYVASERCLLPYLLRKIWKSSDINCGPLSPTYRDGTPYLMNRVCNFSVVFVEVVVSFFFLFPAFSNRHPYQSKTCSRGKVQQNQHGFAVRVPTAILIDG